MSTTVNLAFNEFNNNLVNLESTKTIKANSSRDWLFTQLENLPTKDDNFPRLYSEMNVKFGSFARKTKIRPLDDIDLLITFSADGATYITIEEGKQYALIAPESGKLRNFCNQNNTINSKKLINQVVKSLNLIDQYKYADIRRNQEAATLELSSYEWNFDIVPAFYTTSGHYLIPDGNGEWKATDPRIDQKRVTDVNQQHGGKILQIIRLLKYWNRRPTMPKIPSYLFENLILNYFEEQTEISIYLDINIINFWEHLRTAIYLNLEDPKGFQGDLNTLTFIEQMKISNRSKLDKERAELALQFETEKSDHKTAIKLWADIFGNDFPEFG